MPNPIKWRSKILLAAIEAAYGADQSPTGAANAILATDVQLTPMEGSDVDRELERPYLGADETIATELHSKLSFKVEMQPSGTLGTAPGWGVLLRGCALAEVIDAGVSVTYNPVSDDHESLTFHLYIGGTRYVLVGTRGTCIYRLNAQAIPYLEFEFTGLFKLPSEQARPTPVLTGWNAPKVGTKANTPVFTIDGTSFVMRSFALNFGNTVENRFLIGSEGVLITDRSESIETTVEAQPLSDFDPFTLAYDATQVPVVLTHGLTAGSIATLQAPTSQMQRPQGLENSQNIKEWPLRMVPVPTSGNDQWTLTLT